MNKKTSEKHWRPLTLPYERQDVTLWSYFPDPASNHCCGLLRYVEGRWALVDAAQTQFQGAWAYIREIYSFATCQEAKEVIERAEKEQLSIEKIMIDRISRELNG